MGWLDGLRFRLRQRLDPRRAERALDRGADSRRVMDLLMRLEQEAARAGGRVHLLLGNHEVMNLIGDLRYVADGEYAAYQDVETAEERERWFQIGVDAYPPYADYQEATDREIPVFVTHRQN